MSEGALTLFTVRDAYRYFVCQSWLLMSNSRSRKEYIIPTDNIIVIGHVFNLTKKFNPIGRLQYDLTLF